MPFLIAAVAVNVVLGAVLYLDVVRARRSGWWLLAFWALGPVALVAYLLTRGRRPGVRAG